jgi:hypothetical protein
MSTTDSTLTLVAPDIESALTSANLAPEGVASIRSSFSPHFTAFQEIATTAQTVKPNAPKLARTVRLQLREVRIAAEKTRVSLNEDSQRRVKAINGVNNLLLYALTPIEEAMSSIEKAEEIAQAKLITERAEMRRAELAPFQDPAFYDLGNMPDAQYTVLLTSAKNAKALADAALAKADADRIAQIKKEADERAAKDLADKLERDRLAADNARLAEEAKKAKAAQDAANAKLAKEKADREAEAKKQADAQKARDAQLAAEQAKKDAAAKAAQKVKDDAAEEVRRDLEAKAKTAQAALDAAKAEHEKHIANQQAADVKLAADKAAAAKAPDKAKLLAFAAAINNIPLPVLTTNPELNAQLVTQTNKMVQWLKGLANKL